ncbi:MAG: peptide deformylase [Proteobacteria bacterium]|nr:peptide deformylase [Pseudomonadota bacterium]
MLPIIIAPDERLKIKSAPVEKVDNELREFIADMFDTMYHEKGIGLAAVQVGVHKRVLVADVSWRDEDGSIGEQHVMINPEIVETSAELNVYKEGCLSLPDQFADVTRPKGLRVRFMDMEGKQQEMELDGLLATCVQHEIDHLNGIIFVDHTSALKRDMILRKLTKQKKMGYFDPHDHSNCGHDHSHDHHHHHVHDENCNH